LENDAMFEQHPLFHAIERGNAASLQSLLDAGADPDSGIDAGLSFFPFHAHPHSDATHSRSTPFSKGSFFPSMLAAGLNRPELLRLLIDRGANVHLQGAVFVKDPNPNAWTPLAIAAASGAADCVRLLLDAGARALPSLHGATPLMLAARSGSLECLKSLWEADGGPLAREPSTPWSKNCWEWSAALGGSIDCLDYALGKASAARLQELAQSGLLLQATLGGDADCVRRCLEFCDPNATDEKGWTAAMWAAYATQPSALEALAPVTNLSVGAKPRDGLGSFAPYAKTAGGIQALGLAAQSDQDNARAIALLLAHGADASHQDALGLTALMRSCSNRDPCMSSWPHPANAWALLESSPIDAQDARGFTCAMLALRLNKMGPNKDLFNDPRPVWIAQRCDPSLPDLQGLNLFDHIRQALDSTQQAPNRFLDLKAHFALAVRATLEARSIAAHAAPTAQKTNPRHL
jgi:ankyrin repeat protein